MSIPLNRYRNLDRSDIEAAIKFVKGTLDVKDAPSWIKRFKKEDKKLTIKKNNLFIDGLMVVGNDERDTLMRIRQRQYCGSKQRCRVLHH